MLNSEKFAWKNSGRVSWKNSLVEFTLKCIRLILYHHRAEQNMSVHKIKWAAGMTVIIIVCVIYIGYNGEKKGQKQQQPNKWQSVECSQ